MVGGQRGPFSTADTSYSERNLPAVRNAADLVGFTATVDGKPHPVQIDRVAAIAPPNEENAPLARQYDTPGRDVTAALAVLGLPLMLDHATIMPP